MISTGQAGPAGIHLQDLTFTQHNVDVEPAMLEFRRLCFVPTCCVTTSIMEFLFIGNSVGSVSRLDVQDVCHSVWTGNLVKCLPVFSKVFVYD